MPTGKIGVYTRFFEYANFCLPLSTFLVNVPKHYRISRNYTLDEDTYPQFLRDNDKEMDLLSFIRTTNPTKVRVGKSQRAEGEPKLLDTTMGRVVLLLLVAPARASSELEASVKKLFNEGVSMEIVAKGAVFVLPKSQRKRKTVDSDAGEPLHPAKKLREDHKTSTGPSVVGKSKSALQRLLAGTVLNMEVRVAALPTLPFITSFVSVTPDENITEAEVDSFARPSIPLMTMATTVTSTADQTTTTKERFVDPSIFGGGSFSRAEHTIGRFSSLTGSDFIVGGIRTIVILDTDLQKVAEVRMRAEFNIREKRRLCSILEEKDSLLKTRDEEIKSLKSQLLDEIKSLEERNTTLEKETSVLDVKVADLAATVKVREQEVADSDAMLTTLEKFQDEQMAVVHEKFNKLYFDFFETCLHLEEMFYPHLLTTIVGHRWLLTYGMKLSVFKCLNSSEYFSALGAAISKAIEKGMQDSEDGVWQCNLMEGVVDQACSMTWTRCSLILFFGGTCSGELHLRLGEESCDPPMNMKNQKTTITLEEPEENSRQKLEKEYSTSQLHGLFSFSFRKTSSNILDRGFNVMPSSFHDVGDVEFQDNWGRVWVDIGTSNYFALDVLLNCLTILSSE
ncbi:gypsy type transposase [Tanacetum coccineum]